MMVRKQEELEELVSKVFTRHKIICNFYTELPNPKNSGFWTDVFDYNKKLSEEVKSEPSMAPEEEEKLMVDLKAMGIDPETELNRKREEKKEKEEKIINAPTMNKIEYYCSKLKIDISDIYQKMDGLRSKKATATLDDLLAIGEGIEKRVINSLKEKNNLCYYVKESLKISDYNHLLSFIYDTEKEKADYRNIRMKYISKQLGINNRNILKTCIYEHIKEKQMDEKEKQMKKFEFPVWFLDYYTKLVEYIKDNETFEAKDITDILGESKSCAYTAIKAALEVGIIERTERGCYKRRESNLSEEVKEHYKNLLESVAYMRKQFLDVSKDCIRGKIDVNSLTKYAKDIYNKKKENKEADDLDYFLNRYPEIESYISALKPASFKHVKERISLTDEYLRKSAKLLAEYYTDEKESVKPEIDKMFVDNKGGSFLKKIKCL